MIFEVLWHLTKAIHCCQRWIFYYILQTLKRGPIVSVKIPWSTCLMTEKCSLNTVRWSHIIRENSRLSDRALLAKWKPTSANSHKVWLCKCLVQIPVAKVEKQARARIPHRLPLQRHQHLTLLWLCSQVSIPPTHCAIPHQPGARTQHSPFCASIRPGSQHPASEPAHTKFSLQNAHFGFCWRGKKPQHNATH